jgi:hypothetical protein
MFTKKLMDLGSNPSTSTKFLMRGQKRPLIVVRQPPPRSSVDVEYSKRSCGNDQRNDTGENEYH